LDPPTFGRGKKGEVWKIEEHLLPLLETCAELIGPSPSLLLLTAHTTGFGGLSLQRLVESRFSLGNHRVEQGEMCVLEASGTMLPSGAFARWRNPL
jgi:23S rRNA (cytosine1962-C5)-methyltransferase